MNLRRALTVTALAMAVVFSASAAGAAPVLTRQQTDSSNNGQCQPCPVIDPNVNGPCGANQCPLPPELRDPGFVPPNPTIPQPTTNPPSALPGPAPSPVAPATVAGPVPGATTTVAAHHRVLGGRLVLAFAICLLLTAAVIGLAGFNRSVRLSDAT